MTLRSGTVLTLAALGLVLLASSPGRPARADDWPCWRGPRQDGISRETGLLKAWPRSGPKQLWKAKLSGGFSTVAVAGGRVFTQTKEKNQEVVVCLNAATGEGVWRYRYHCDYGAHPTFTGGGRPQARTGPRSTPAVVGDRVYTLGATGILLCLDVKKGKEVWRKDLLKIGARDCPRHGYCCCPLVVGNRLYVHPGGRKGKSLAALDTRDGKVVWQSLDAPIGEGSPIWVKVNGIPQVIFFTGAGAVGVAPKDGKLLWRYPWKTRFNLNIATPIYAAGKVFISSNYGVGGAVIRLTGKGEPETVWKKKTMQNHFSTSVLYRGHLYGFSVDRLRCVDFKTGDVKWDHPGLGKGSLVLADGHLFILGDQGQLVLAKATPDKYTPVSRSQVFDEDTLTWTVPVVSGGKLFVRSENTLLALDVKGNGK
jgi:outer membrane protein assembly factor BamB